MPLEFAGSAFDVFEPFAVAAGFTVGELVAVPVALAVALDVVVAAVEDPIWPLEGALQAESRSITASVIV